MSSVVIPKMTGARAAHDPDKEHLDLVRARNVERLERVWAQATGELKRMTGLTLNAEGKVDEMALTKALAGQDIARRMRLRSMRLPDTMG
jgi:hypothetical protein